MIFRAHLETKRFTFDAYGDTESAAHAALTVGLREHARQYALPITWFDIYLDAVYVEACLNGECYRDRETLVMS